MALSALGMNLQCRGKPLFYSILTRCKKEAPAIAGASPSRSPLELVAAVDVDVADVAAIVDVALPRQVGRRIGAVGKRTIGADAIRTVAVVGITTAAREAADSHAVARRLLLRDAENPAVGAGRNADQRAEDRAEAGPIVEAILHRRRALLRSDAGVHAGGSVGAVAVRAIAVVRLAVPVRVILGRRRGRRRNRREAGRTGEHFRDHTHGSVPPSKTVGAFGLRTPQQYPRGGIRRARRAGRRARVNAS